MHGPSLQLPSEDVYRRGGPRLMRFHESYGAAGADAAAGGYAAVLVSAVEYSRRGDKERSGLSKVRRSKVHGW